MTTPAGIRLVSPGQLPPWQYGLLHDRPAMTLLWLTRGQGRITVNGIRRGLGAHNAVFVPPGVLFAFDPGPQALTLVLHAPASEDALFPVDGEGVDEARRLQQEQQVQQQHHKRVSNMPPKM